MVAATFVVAVARAAALVLAIVLLPAGQDIIGMVLTLTIAKLLRL